MQVGISIRLMGPQSTRETIAECARAAEEAELDDLWVPDHIAIPPDDAEGSGGRYLDALASLAWLAGRTERIGLGTGVLILPYRPALPTAKVVATVQELSGGRLRLGVGIGWMDAEFRATGVKRSRRGAISDETLAFLRDCFEHDTVRSHGQPFLFRPRPKRPPIYVGGAPPHALRRAVAYGDGWMPIARDPESLGAPIAELRALAEAEGKPPPEVIALTGLPLADLDASVERARAFSRVGVTQLVSGTRYDTAADFTPQAAQLGKVRRAL